MTADTPTEEPVPENAYRAKDRRVELKFMLSDDRALEVRRWAYEHLQVDRYCDPDASDSYEVNTLYLDTHQLDICRQTKKAGRAKHRIRRYGDEGTVWLETKRKSKNIVRKNRTVIPAEQTDRVAHALSDSNLAAWPGRWFQLRVHDRLLHPTALVHYRRFARLGYHHGKAFRLTIDSQLGGRPYDDWLIPSRNGAETNLLPAAQILELKFHDVLPPLFKRLLIEFPITATRFSKFRKAVEMNKLLSPTGVLA